MTQEKKQFNLRIPADLFDALTLRSRLSNISMNQLIVDALRTSLEASETNSEKTYSERLDALEVAVEDCRDRLKQLVDARDTTGGYKRRTIDRGDPLV